ncbi:MAG: nicotinate-nucleotide adenylyltransferase [Lachnospiraceae bacterium]|nr:nicotinate-nucleotide adenylyltransferase [Lachnospiraceae bacterium]
MEKNSILKKIGILGGTFNPIHIGHLILAQNALEHCGLDKVLIMPSGCSYLKDPKNIADKDHRLAMVRLATEDNDSFCVSTIETEREGNSYTCDTLKILVGDNPDTQYYYIIGEDILFTIDKWKDPEGIFSRCTIVCAQRENQPDDGLKDRIRHLENEYNAKVILMDVPEIAVSSSMIRKLISEGKSCRYYLDEKVMNYIKENHLYEV